MNLVDTLYNHFQSVERPREKQAHITFAPSYLSDCARKIFYSKTAVAPSNPPDLPALLKMHMGKVQHTEIQKILNELGALESFEEAKRIEYQGLTFNYFYDGILNVDGLRYIMEIKTIYGAGFEAVRESPKDEHIIQALSYMVFEKIPQAIILYIGRDNGYMVQHELKAENKILFINGKETDYLKKWSDRIQRMKLMKDHIEQGLLPERDFTIVMKNSKGVISEQFQKDNKKYKSDWQCSYCSFKDLCWKEEIEQMANHNFFIDGKFI